MTVTECAKLLGEALAADETVIAMNAAKAAFESDETLQKQIMEYNTQRALLGQEFSKDTAMQDAELIAKLQDRINELYTAVVESPVYVAFNETQQKVSALMQAVNSDINFYAFGERPCTHDCSSCHADCASKAGQ